MDSNAPYAEVIQFVQKRERREGLPSNYLTTNYANGKAMLPLALTFGGTKESKVLVQYCGLILV